jgi:2-amino-4-hydroxy-6-hydroxymethyldihydropteridine diphosphokinase
MSDGPCNRAYLSLGSNIEPEIHLPAAVRELAAFGRLIAVSRAWESAAVDSKVPAQNFLNAAVLLETELSAEAICDEAAATIERRLGRVRDPQDKNAARTIDVDLSLFNDAILTISHRAIPDPAILTRAFVAVPLAEVDPDYLHPLARRTLSDIAAELAAGQRLWARDEVALAFKSSQTESSR